MENNYDVLGYEIYEEPKNPRDNGKYYGQTPVLEQAEAIVANGKEIGKRFFIKVVCSDGIRRYLGDIRPVEIIDHK